MSIREGDLLWTPSEARRTEGPLPRFVRWAAERGAPIAADAPYEDIWKWSTEDLEGFWGAIWDYYGVKSVSRYDKVLGDRTMPGAEWFPGATLNYAANVFAKLDPGAPAIIFRSELTDQTVMTGAELAAKVAAVAAGLEALGVAPGDRVAAYLPNIPETVVAFLATASLGAVWSSCSPDFGTKNVVDRFQQIAPKVLLTIDGYRYGGKDLDRRPQAQEIQAALPSAEHVFEVAYLHGGAPREGARSFSELLDTPNPPELAFTPVPFAHPLWVLYSSGTTGLPKPIVQSQGGILLEHLKVLGLHTEIEKGDRFFWFTTTGWMMWNYIVSGLLHGAAVVLFDGNPGYPGLDTLWKFAEDAEVTYFGTSAAFIQSCLKAGLVPKDDHDLSKLKGVGSTGSPLSVDGFKWVYDAVSDDLCLGSVSGGTDICSCFVASTSMRPVHAGEIQARCLGVSIEAWSEAGEPVTEEVGEMVITQPMPSMPIYFWNDEGNQRYLSSYFEDYPGVWRHGDFVHVTKHDGVVIHGRSDSTLNRGGIRIGTAEIYRTVEALPEVKDSLVVNVDRDGDLFMPLFVVLADGVSLDEALTKKIKVELRKELSPRHVPDAVLAIPEVPMTLSGKKMEIPARKVMSGIPLDMAMSRGACKNPAAMEQLAELAKTL